VWRFIHGQVLVKAELCLNSAAAAAVAPNNAGLRHRASVE
jgi:hypothetical protein